MKENARQAILMAEKLLFERSMSRFLRNKIKAYRRRISARRGHAARIATITTAAETNRRGFISIEDRSMELDRAVPHVRMPVKVLSKERLMCSHALNHSSFLPALTADRNDLSHSN